MLLIFDSCGGLCNQMLDIQCALHFVKKYQFKFTFRYCSFRTNKLSKFIPMPFDYLFNTKYFNYFENFIPFDQIKNNINEDNTFNYNSQNIIKLSKNEEDLLILIHSLQNKFKYIIIPQIYSISNFQNQIYKFYVKIKPNPRLFKIFIHLKKHLLPNKYNFIHFRYEQDFKNTLKINYIQSIDSLLQRITFKNNNLKIYIACSNIKSLSKTAYLTNDIYSYSNIIFKDDYMEKYNIQSLNFEEKAFIDFLIGINSCEIYGHFKSSFSKLLNLFKQTKNYYNNY